jgi:hypothetical protein
MTQYSLGFALAKNVEIEDQQYFYGGKFMHYTFLGQTISNVFHSKKILFFDQFD